MKSNRKLSGGGRTAAALFGFAAITLAGAALAQEKPAGTFGWFGVGKALELEKGHWYWVGEFSGSFFSDKGPGKYKGLKGGNTFVGVTQIN